MSVSFADLGVPANLVERLRARGIIDAFPIQEAAIPDALEGRDVVGKAITGSGKTLAFALPLMARLGKARPRQPLALVLVPTRELAAQVQKEIAQLTDDRGRRVICIYGGTSYNIARKALNFGVDVVVACPGRLEDMLEQRALDLSSVTTVVVDEADRMADMGFLPAVRRIVASTSSDRHVMLFSATMGPDVSSLVREFTHDAAIHDVVGDEAPSDVDHYFWKVPRDRRPDITADIIETYERAIIFTRTKHGADRLARQLGERGISAVPLHGDRSQAQRERALRSVKSGQIKVLVATDVAARGIHIDLLPVVVHYDPPAQATDYLHRSGRTGRAGATGAVISLVGEDVIGQVKRLQRALGINPSIEGRETAPAIRLGAVDDAVAAERLDERSPKKRPESAAPRERDRGPRNFERREPRERANAGRSDHRSHDTDQRPTRGFERRESTPSRDDSAGRGFDRRETRLPRGDNAGRGFERRESTPSRSESAGHGRGSEGVVAFFNDSKGFGFASDEKGDDLFIHFSSIVGDGFKSLSQGQKITFEEAQGPKGREAKNVRVVSAGRSRR
jgi:superfamily II DNA/RNA helicase